MNTKCYRASLEMTHSGDDTVAEFEVMICSPYCYQDLTPEKLSEITEIIQNAAISRASMERFVDPNGWTILSMVMFPFFGF